MTAGCIDCGSDVGPLSPEMVRAKTRLGLPLDPPKRCPKCIWSALQKLADDLPMPSPEGEKR